MSDIPAHIGEYEVLRKLAVGGMAEVFLARGSGGLVALKRILPQFEGVPELCSMFADEARLAARLDHPNIARGLAVGEGERPFYTLEYVRGRDVLGVLRAATKHGGVPLAEALAIVCGVATGLHHAHELRDAAGAPLGIVHRDISPANVLVGFDGEVKLVDFGVAKAHRRSSETRAGMVKGKLGYMSPEQCQRMAVDRRSDVFALGILLYELTTATRLYRGKTEYEVLTQVATGDVEPPAARRPGYPAALAAIVMKALARNPGDRYATTAELELALRQFAATQGITPAAVDLGGYLDRLFPGESDTTLREGLEDDEPATRLWQPQVRAATLLGPVPLPVRAPAEAASATAAAAAAPVTPPAVAMVASPGQALALATPPARPRRRILPALVAWAAALLVIFLQP